MTVTVTNGQTVSDIVIGNGNAMIVESGGRSVATELSFGGIEVVEPGGAASASVLSLGGTLGVSAGAMAFGTILSSGGVEIIAGAAIQSVISSGGIENVEAGGTLTSSTVLFGGNEFVDSGGTSFSTVISSGAIENLTPFGTANATIIESGGIETVASGGLANATVVQGGGTLLIFPGGAANGNNVQGGAVYSGSAYAVNAGQTSGGNTLQPADIETVMSGGTASGTNVGLYAQLDVALGGRAVGAIVSDFGAVNILGIASGTILQGLGFEYVSAGGTAVNTVVNSGGSEYVYSAGTAVGTTVKSGGFEVVSSGDIVSNTSLDRGGGIDVQDLPFAGGGTASVNVSDLLTVSVGGQTYLQQLAGSYAGVKFDLSEDSNGGTLVTAACYVAGTRIQTIHGEVAVEDLRLGDPIRTVLGNGVEPVVWIGYRQIDCGRHPEPRNVWPVRIRAHAFGLSQPHSDLFLSPDHAIYINNVLIPVKYLVNGGTIAQVPVKSVAYYHIELPRHEVVLARGLPAESYLDIGDRSNFTNGDQPVRLFPDFAARRWETHGCAPLIVIGPELAAARALVEQFAAAYAAA